MSQHQKGIGCIVQLHQTALIPICLSSVRINTSLNYCTCAVFGFMQSADARYYRGCDIIACPGHLCYQ